MLLQKKRNVQKICTKLCVKTFSYGKNFTETHPHTLNTVRACDHKETANRPLKNCLHAFQ